MQVIKTELANMQRSIDHIFDSPDFVVADKMDPAMLNALAMINDSLDMIAERVGHDLTFEERA